MTPQGATRTTETLVAAHALGALSCGEASLDRWLRDSALQAQAMRTARTFVWHEGDARVVAYFSLAAHLLRRADIPPRLARGEPDALDDKAARFYARYGFRAAAPPGLRLVQKVSDLAAALGPGR